MNDYVIPLLVLIVITTLVFSISGLYFARRKKIVMRQCSSLASQILGHSDRSYEKALKHMSKIFAQGERHGFSFEDLGRDLLKLQTIALASFRKYKDDFIARHFLLYEEISQFSYEEVAQLTKSGNKLESRFNDSENKMKALESEEKVFIEKYMRGIKSFDYTEIATA